jgi:hypothetical protein
VKSTIKGYYQWEELRMENFFGDDSFNELLIYPKNDNKDELSQSSSQIESNESESIDDRYLSYAERKIMDRLNANEKLIRELHQKIDSLIDQNNKGD